MWHIWRNMFLNVADKHAPIRTKRVGSFKSPWITSHLKQCMHRRDVLKILLDSLNDPNDWRAFKNCRNSVNNEIKLAKQRYYKEDFHECVGNPRKTWGVINELTSRKSKSSFVNEIKCEGVSITDSSDLTEAFNDHFVTVGPKLADEISTSVNNRSPLHYLSNHIHDHEPFQLELTNNSKVFSLLYRLSKSKATGLDKISARLLRECADLISNSLCLIFNCSISTGVFSDEWKCSKVIPLFKNGSHSELNNYRPISIIPVVAKVFERIVYDHVLAYINNNTLISNCQSGFRGLHSTATAL